MKFSHCLYIFIITIFLIFSVNFSYQQGKKDGINSEREHIHQISLGKKIQQKNVSSNPESLKKALLNRYIFGNKNEINELIKDPEKHTTLINEKIKTVERLYKDYPDIMLSNQIDPRSAMGILFNHPELLTSLEDRIKTGKTTEIDKELIFDLFKDPYSAVKIENDALLRFIKHNPTQYSLFALQMFDTIEQQTQNRWGEALASNQEILQLLAQDPEGKKLLKDIFEIPIEDIEMMATGRFDIIDQKYLKSKVMY